MSTRLIAYLVGIASFAKEIALHRPEIIHIHTASNGSFARKSLLTWWASLSGVPVVLHVHGGGFKKFFQTSPRIIRSFIRATLERADAVAALGSTWGKDLQAIAPSANVFVVPNAVRISVPVNQEGVTQVSVVFLGKVCDGKGTFVLLDAWAKVINDFGFPVPPRLVIAGDGEIDRARERVTALSIGGTCEVRGWIAAEEVADLLAGSQVLVLPSLAEGQPMSILEAMARGLVVVASDVGGIPEMLSDEVGILVKPSDSDDLANKLAWVISNPRERALFGANAYARVERELNLEHVSAQFDELYRDVLSARARCRRPSVPARSAHEPTPNNRLLWPRNR